MARRIFLLGYLYVQSTVLFLCARSKPAAVIIQAKQELKRLHTPVITQPAILITSLRSIVRGIEFKMRHRHWLCRYVRINLLPLWCTWVVRLPFISRIESPIVFKYVVNHYYFIGDLSTLTYIHRKILEKKNSARFGSPSFKHN